MRSAEAELLDLRVHLLTAHARRRAAEDTPALPFSVAATVAAWSAAERAEARAALDNAAGRERPAVETDNADGRAETGGPAIDSGKTADGPATPGERQPDPAHRDAQGGEAGDAGPPSCWHSDDFTSVHWFGNDYTFTPGQRAGTVKLLWAQHRGGRWHGIAQRTIAEAVGSGGERFALASVFRDHPAWRTMIVSAGPGVYRLRRPDERDADRT